MEVLLIDDDTDCAEISMAAAEMAKVGFNISLVGDGVEAMNYLHKKEKYAGVTRPDLILLDLELPKKTGREVLAEIQADEDLKKIPVVILSSTDRFQELIKTYGLTNNACRTKPALFADYVSIMKSIKVSFVENRIFQ